MTDTNAKYESLGFTNDLIFKFVLSSDIELCRELINRIDPEMNTEGIHFVESEHEVIVGVRDEKRVRFDIMTRTDKNVTDLEMYAYKPKGYPASFPKTARYNAAMIDSQLPKGHLPADLPDVEVILLCTYDPLGMGEPVYHIRTKVDEYPEYDYNEGRRICILTNKGIDKAPEKLKPIIHLLTCSDEPMNDAFYEKIQAAVKEIKTDPDVRRAAMILEEKYNAIREEGLEEGRKEGRKEGLTEGIEEGIQEGIRNTITILRELNLSEKAIIARLLEKYPSREEFIRKIMSA
ncbi:MAG: hypothetical protein IKG55_07060 [Solobacterium sp.]|nr:hypothetical protein [Solobacterium sp.]